MTDIGPIVGAFLYGMAAAMPPGACAPGGKCYPWYGTVPAPHYIVPPEYHRPPPYYRPPPPPPPRPRQESRNDPQTNVLKYKIIEFCEKNPHEDFCRELDLWFQRHPEEPR